MHLSDESYEWRRETRYRGAICARTSSYRVRMSPVNDVWLFVCRRRAFAVANRAQIRVIACKCSGRPAILSVRIISALRQYSCFGERDLSGRIFSRCPALPPSGPLNPLQCPLMQNSTFFRNLGRIFFCIIRFFSILSLNFENLTL